MKILGCNPNLGSNQSMSLSQIKSIPHISICFKTSPKKYTFSLVEKTTELDVGQQRSLKSVFTKSVWIKEKALVLAQEQVCTKGQSNMAFLKFLDPDLCTYTHMHAPNHYQAYDFMCNQLVYCLGAFLNPQQQIWA